MVTLPTWNLQLICDHNYQPLFQEANLVAVAPLLFRENLKITEFLLHGGFFCAMRQQNNLGRTQA